MPEDRPTAEYSTAGCGPRTVTTTCLRTIIRTDNLSVGFNFRTDISTHGFGVRRTADAHTVDPLTGAPSSNTHARKPDMTALTDPTDHSVAELKDALEAVDDAEELRRLLDAEREGDDRVTAIDAIEERLETVTGDGESEDTTDRTGSAPDPADTATDGFSGTNAGISVEEPWSKDASVGDEGGPASDHDPENVGVSIEAIRSEIDTGGVPVGALDHPTERTEPSPANGASTENVGERLLESLERIRHTYEDTADKGGRVEARIHQLQTEVGDLKAYTTALEEFLDEEGTGRQVIESVRADMASLEDDLAAVTDDVRVHGRNLGKLWEVLEDVENELTRLHEVVDRQRRETERVAADVEDLETDLEEVSETADDRHADVSGRLDGVDETLADHEGAMDDLGDEVDAVSDDVDAVSEDVDAVSEGVDAVSDDVDAVSEDVDAVSEEIDAVSADVDAVSEDVDDVAGQVDAVSDQVDAVSDHVEGVAADVQELDAAVDERFAEGSEARAALSERIDDNADAIDELSSTVEAVAADVAALEELVGESGRVDSRFESVEEEIEALQEWREQLSSVILGGGEPNANLADQ